jgi:tRNA threonylcarbamoyladenosine biosynthesis protein TsaE
MTQIEHSPILGSRQLHWPDEAACAAAAATLARSPAQAALHDATIELDGPLGAGKTTFVRHLLHALGVEGRVKSPTYAVVEPYEVGPLRIGHFDFYRFDDPHEWEDAGLRDVFGAAGLKLVEWAAKAAPLLPAPDLRLALSPREGTARDVRVDAFTPRGVELLEGFDA